MTGFSYLSQGRFAISDVFLIAPDGVFCWVSDNL